MFALEDVRSFFRAVNESDKAKPWLHAYDMNVCFELEDTRFTVVIDGGKIVEIADGLPPTIDLQRDLVVSGERSWFQLVLEGRITPATAMFHGKLLPKGARAKHNQAVVAFRLMRLAQQRSVLTSYDSVEGYLDRNDLR